MRLATFTDGFSGPRFGIVRGEHVVDVVTAAYALHWPVPATSVKAALTSGPQTLAALEALVSAAEGNGLHRPVADVRFLPPIPDPSKFFCVGKNNRKHREELKANKMLTEVPNEPTGFIKLTDTMSGDGDEVVRPDGITTLDYEPELCYLVGKRAHGVRKADAMDYIAGFTLMNDVSAREIQQREVASGSRFWTAKNMPGFAPVGPHILTMDEVPDTENLWVTCRVNGEPRLRSNTGDYLYKIADVLEHFSRYVVFEPGDLIAMGAPSGVAVGQPNAAELYLKPGDDMVIAFERLMSLRTRIVAPRRTKTVAARYGGPQRTFKMNNNIKEHMEVIGADGVHIGTVDRVENGKIKLTKADSGEGKHKGHHHFIDLGLVAEVEGQKVRLSANADVAVTMEEEKS